jgi:DNA-binding transcriptional LysR family regulator
VAERALARAGHRPANVWELDSFEAITHAVNEGLGVSFISRRLVGKELERQELSEFRVHGVERMLRPIYALQPTATEPAAEASSFMALIEQEASPSNPAMAAIA